MRIFYTVIFALTFSSNIFAKTKLIDSYEMEHTKESDLYNVVCIDGYQYLVENSSTIQMLETRQGKSRLVKCPIRKSQER